MDLKVRSCHDPKYLNYLSQSPEKTSLGQEHVCGLRLSISGNLDKYFKYLESYQLKTFKYISPRKQKFQHVFFRKCQIFTVLTYISYFFTRSSERCVSDGHFGTLVRGGRLDDKGARSLSTFWVNFSGHPVDCLLGPYRGQNKGKLQIAITFDSPGGGFCSQWF